MRVLLQQSKGNYGKVANWLQGSKTYGDGTYNYKQKRKCEVCEKQVS